MLAHRDWSPKREGTAVHVRRPPRDLEPGQAATAHALVRPRYGQASRNKVTARVLGELGYIEMVGLGIRRMREGMARLGLPEPEFREDGFRFVLTLHSIAPREGVAAPADTFGALVERGEINEGQYRALQHTRQQGTIARREYVALTGVSEGTAANDLA